MLLRFPWLPDNRRFNELLERFDALLNGVVEDRRRNLKEVHIYSVMFVDPQASLMRHGTCSCFIFPTVDIQSACRIIRRCPAMAISRKMLFLLFEFRVRDPPVFIALMVWRVKGDDAMITSFIALCGRVRVTERRTQTYSS
jgi:hypothetical protein